MIDQGFFRAESVRYHHRSLVGLLLSRQNLENQTNVIWDIAYTEETVENAETGDI